MRLQDGPPVRRTPYLVVTVAALLLGVAALGLRRAGGPVPSLDAVRALARSQKFDQARTLLGGYLRAYPEDSRAHLLMAQLATEPPDPRPDLALEHLAAIRPRDPKQAALLRFFEGKAHYQRARYDLTETSWREALRLDPTVPEAGWALIELLDKEGRVEEAHRLGMRLHQEEPDPRDRARILLEMARLDIDQVSPGSQVQLFEPLVRQHPENLPLSLTVGLALVRDSRGEPGVEFLESVLRRHPDSPEAWDAWLTGLYGAFQFDRMAKEFDRLPKAMAADLRFAKHEGMIAQNARDWPRAVRAYRRAVAREPYNGILSYRLRAALRMTGDTAELERVNRSYTSFEESFKQLRPVYQGALADSTLGLTPHPQLYQRLADLRERMGRPEEARAWHRLVLRDDPNNAISLAAIGRLE
jgi:tetratricopeptide (TPR) repeat protein